MLGRCHSLDPEPCVLIGSLTASGVIRTRLGRAETTEENSLAQTSQRALRRERPSPRGSLPLSHPSSRLVLKGSRVPPSGAAQPRG